MDQAIALIGFGEAGRSFAGAAGWGAAARVFDVKTDYPALRGAMQDAYTQAGVTGCVGLASALDRKALVLSLVTADQALVAARHAAQHIAPGSLYCDMNSVAPATKQAAAEAIEAAGAHYLDVAIMAPVSPRQMAIPVLVSGPHAARALALLVKLGFSNVRAVGNDVGRAATIKMLRSVMVKGVEALTAECLLACHKAGVTKDVLASFGDEWAGQANYHLDRMMTHGLRRAAEMTEVAQTLEDLGIKPLMSAGTIERQRALGALEILSPPRSLTEKLERLAGCR